MVFNPKANRTGIVGRSMLGSIISRKRRISASIQGNKGTKVQTEGTGEQMHLCGTGNMENQIFDF